MATKMFAVVMLFICLFNYEVYAGVEPLCPGKATINNCLIDPCDTLNYSCKGYICRADYCDGCNVNWVKDLDNPGKGLPNCPKKKRIYYKG